MMRRIRNDGWRGGRLQFKEGVHEPYEKVTAEQKPDGDKGVSHADVWERGGTAGRRNSTCKRP